MALGVNGAHSYLENNMILIVDDKPENVYSLEKLLRAKGFETDTAVSGESALKKSLRNDYALIILDVHMPGMDGFEVAETLTGLNKTKDIPIIFLSAASADKEFIAKGYSSGGIDYLTKPVDSDILLLKVKTFYRLFEQTKALQDAQEALREEMKIRELAEQELRERYDQQRFILESLPQIAFMLDDTGKIDFVNKRWFQYFPKDGSFDGSGSDQDTYMQEWQLAREQGKLFEREVYIKEVDSNVSRCHLLRIVPMKGRAELTRWVGTFTDIDDRKAIEKKKDEFLSIASHELKTPLTSIKVFSQLAERSMKNQKDSPTYGYISRVKDQVEKLSNLVTDLLDNSKLENGKLKINRVPFDFEATLLHTSQSVVEAHPDRNIIIERQGDKIVDPIFGDEVRIEQVLNNFLTNAIKYAPDSNRIVIKTQVEDGRLEVQVQDFGIGIHPLKLPCIFEKFYRVDESSMKFQGLGLGLYICAEILKQHEGTWGVNSKVGEGSTFYFTLPIK